MRWQVQGNDAITGQPLTLGIDEPEAVQAVHSALAKKILVTRISATRPFPRLFFGCIFLLILALAGMCIYLYRSRQIALNRLHDTASQESQLTKALTQTEESLRSLSAHLSAVPVKPAATSTSSDAQQALLDQLAAAQSRISTLETQLSEPVTPAPDPTVATLRQQLTDAQHHATDLEAQLKTFTAQGDARFAALSSDNKTQAQQIDALKSELLIAAAKSTIPPTVDADKTPDPLPVLPTRWALATGFSDAADFLNIHFDKETVRYEPSADDTVLGLGTWTANADTLHLLFDHDKQRLYSATLVVSLAPDAPKQKITENLDLTATFIHTFAPSVKDPETWIASSLQDLSGKSSNQRILLVADEYLITVWNEDASSGLVHFKIESAASALTQ